MSDTETTTRVGSMPPPGTPFSAPPPPQNGSHDEELVDELLSAPSTSTSTSTAAPNVADELELELDARGAGRDLTLALRGIEEIDMRLVTLQAQLTLIGAVALIGAIALLLEVKARARGNA
jgi:hypothetical protein